MNGYLRCAVAALMAAAIVCGCWPAKEKHKLIKNLNESPKIAERGGRVREIEVGEAPDKDALAPFVAEVYDGDGNAIGKVRGDRVEGFGTIVRSYVWYDEPGWEEKEARLAAQDARKKDSKGTRWTERRADVGLLTPREQKALDQKTTTPP